MPFLLCIQATYQRGMSQDWGKGPEQYPMRVEIGTPVSYGTSEVIQAQELTVAPRE